MTFFYAVNKLEVDSELEDLQMFLDAEDNVRPGAPIFYSPLLIEDLCASTVLEPCPIFLSTLLTQLWMKFSMTYNNTSTLKTSAMQVPELHILNNLNKRVTVLQVSIQCNFYSTNSAISTVGVITVYKRI